MSETFENWLDEVRGALRSINMPLKEWQAIWPFDFAAEHKAGAKPDDPAMKANRFGWHHPNKSMGRDCDRLPGWLPRGRKATASLTTNAAATSRLSLKVRTQCPASRCGCLAQLREWIQKLMIEVKSTFCFRRRQSLI